MKPFQRFAASLTLLLSLLAPLALVSPLEIAKAKMAAEDNSVRVSKHDDKEDVDYYEDASITLPLYHNNNKDELVNVVYSDEIFFKASTEYHHLLARQSIGFAICATHLLREEDEEDPLQGSLYDYFDTNGFDMDELRIDDYYKETSIYTVGTAIATKTIRKGGEVADLIAVAIRGAQYKKEWQSNLTVESGMRHEGFAYAASLVEDRIYSYIAQHTFHNPIKIWLSGFSRAGCITNMVAGDLTDNPMFDKSQIYAYTFAAPAGIWYNREEGKDHLRKGYENIFNIIGASDPIPRFVPGEWGYGRFGIDKYLPGSEFNSNFNYLYSRIQDWIHKHGGKTYYNPDLNLRVRLLFGMLMEMAGDELGFTFYLQPILVNILTNATVNNLANLFRETMISWKTTNQELTAKKDAIIDFALATIPQMILGNGYMKDKKGTIKNPLQFLAHEHFSDIYFLWMNLFEEEELFLGSDEFTYLYIQNSGKVSVKSQDKEILTLQKGCKTLSDYAKYNNIDLTVSDYGDSSLLILPHDKEYSVTYSLEEGATMNVNVIPYGREYQSRLIRYGNSLSSFSPREGTLLAIEAEKANINGKRTESTSGEIGDLLRISSVGLPYKGILFLAIVVIVLSLGLLLFAIILITSRIFHFEAPIIRLLLILGVILGALEAEIAFWFLSDFLFISILFKAVSCLCIMLLYIYKRDRREFLKPHHTLLPFFLLSLIGYLLIGYNMIAGMVLFILSLVYLCYFYLRDHRLNTKMWIIYGVIAALCLVLGFIAFHVRTNPEAIIFLLTIPPLLLSLFLNFYRRPIQELSFFFYFLAFVSLGFYEFTTMSFTASVIFIILYNVSLAFMATTEGEDVIEGIAMDEEEPLAD